MRTKFTSGKNRPQIAIAALNAGDRIPWRLVLLDEVVLNSLLLCLLKHGFPLDRAMAYFGHMHRRRLHVIRGWEPRLAVFQVNHAHAWPKLLHHLHGIV